MTHTETDEADMLVRSNAVIVIDPISRIIAYTYECAAYLERSNRYGLYRLTSADYSTGELFEYAYRCYGLSRN